MKVLAATLILAGVLATLAAGSLFSRGEGVLWMAFVVFVSVVGYAWAARDRKMLPHDRQEQLRHMGYIPAVTSAMSAEHTKRFCILLGSLLGLLFVRVAVHYV